MSNFHPLPLFGKQKTGLGLFDLSCYFRRPFLALAESGIVFVISPMTRSPEAALAARPEIMISKFNTLIRQASFLCSQVEIVNEKG